MSETRRPKIYSYTDEDWIEYADALEAKIAALERRARIAERTARILAENTARTINAGSPEHYESLATERATREIDAELAKEQAK